MKTIRIIIAAPFVLIGAIFYQVAEWISGEMYVRHEKEIERNTIFNHKMYQSKNYHRRKGARHQKPKRKK